MYFHTKIKQRNEQLLDDKNIKNNWFFLIKKR